MTERSHRRADRDADRVAVAGLATAAAGALLVFTPWLNDTYALPKLVILALGAAIAWAGVALGARRSPPRLATPLDSPLAALGGAVALAALLSVDRLLSLTGQYGSYFYGVFPLAVVAALYYASARVFRTAKSPDRLFHICAAGGSIAAAYALLQKAGIEPVPGVPQAPEGAIPSTIGTTSDLGACLVVLLPLSLYLALGDDRRPRILGRVSAVLIGLALIATLSFPAYAGAAAGCAAALVLSGRPDLRRLSVGARKALGAGAAAALLAGLVLAAGFFRDKSPADAARIETWKASISAFARNPIVGTGPDTLMLAFRRYRSEGTLRAIGDRMGNDTAHDDLLQSAVTTGVVGLAAYLWLLWAAALALRSALAEPGRRPAVSAAAGALIGLFVHAKVQPTPLPALALAAMWLGASLPRKDSQGRPPEAPKFVPWAVLSGCVLLLLLGGWSCRADRAQRLAAAALEEGKLDDADRHFARAVELAPWEMRYKAAYNRLLLLRAGGLKDERLRGATLHKAMRLGREAVRWHPGDPAAHNMLGLSLYFLAAYGGPDHLEEAARVLETAQELDPYFMPLLRARVLVAAAKGDEARAQSLHEEYLRLLALLPKPPPPAGQAAGAGRPAPAAGG